MALSPTTEEWQAAARTAIETAAAGGYLFTTEDLEAWVGPPPNRNGWQGAINRAAARHLITVCGQAKSKKPSRNGAWVCVYRGTNEKEDES